MESRAQDAHRRPVRPAPNPGPWTLTPDPKSQSCTTLSLHVNPKHHPYPGQSRTGTRTTGAALPKPPSPASHEAACPAFRLTGAPRSPPTVSTTTDCPTRRVPAPTSALPPRSAVRPCRLRCCSSTCTSTRPSTASSRDCRTAPRCSVSRARQRARRPRVALRSWSAPRQTAWQRRCSGFRLTSQRSARCPAVRSHPLPAHRSQHLAPSTLLPAPCSLSLAHSTFAHSTLLTRFPVHRSIAAARRP